MPTHLRVTQSLAEETPVEYQKLGIVGDGKTFDHKGVANLASAIDEGGIVHLGGAPVMLLGETVNWSQLRGRVLTSDRLPNPDGVNVPRFIWDGARYGTMLQWDRINAFHLDGIAFETDDRDGVRAPAGVALDLDGGDDTRTNPTEQAIGSSCRLTRLRHISNKPTPGITVERKTQPDAKGNFDTIQVPAPIFIALGTKTQFNQEYHELRECEGNGNGAGTFLYQGRSPNIVATRVLNSRGIIGYERGIFMHGGSIYLDLLNLSTCQWALWLENGSQISTATRLHGEANQHLAYIDSPLELSGSKLDAERALPLAADGHGFIHIGSRARDVRLRGDLDGSLPDGAVVFTFDNDASCRSVDVELTLQQPLTRAQLGIDRAALMGRGNPDRQAGCFQFRTQPGAVTDLPSGALEFNVSAPTREFMAAGRLVTPLQPAVSTLLNGPVDWSLLTPGTSLDYLDAGNNYVMRQMCLPDGSHAAAIVGKLAKVKA